jgi:hypothetical protein
MLDLKFLRKFLGWNFAFLSLICAVASFWITLSTVHVQLNKAPSHPFALLLNAVFPAVALIFGVTWWEVWKQRPFARAWGIAASALLAAVPLRRIILFPQTAHGYTVVVLAIGIAGVVVFSMSDRATPDTENPELEEPSTEGT